MPWIEARLRGQKVMARANADGSFVDEDGRVEIRYKTTDGRAYRAAKRNLEVIGAGVFPDDHCVPGDFVPARDDAKKSDGAERNASATKTAGGSAKTTAAAAKKKADAAKSATSPGVAPSKEAWVAYTDGACSGNPGPAGSGFIVIAPDGKMAEGFESLGIGTNNTAELTAILRAAEAMPDDAAEVVIHTDSKYAIGVLSQGWKAKANQALIADTKRAIAGLKKVRFVYVPGHAGVPLNERADELAREAIRTSRTQPIRLPTAAST